ncbi:MAG TPA: membrane protein insertion efficiency factor YidD [Candidatus Baltobacteraceae bacterium]|nr:membrane protein insertion efficiency factor YidD [Candidatus Baltobacteraceae bacterium]
MNLIQRILIFVIRLYRLVISPAQIFLFGAGSGCRFTPTCSQYAMDAIRERGAIIGSWLAVKRICRCHPFGGCGHDPVGGKIVAAKSR